MKRTVWYGSDENGTKFFDNQDQLRQSGLKNTGNFSVDGSITDLRIEQPVNQDQGHARQPAG